jgi:hypothetical protein
MRIALLSLGTALALCACDRPVTAPTRTGVCWFMVEGLNGEPDFKPFATNIENLESCAARLEGAYVKSGHPVRGAFQGRFIFVDEADVTAGPRLRGQHYRVFTPQQRAQIRANLLTLRERERMGR